MQSRSAISPASFSRQPLSKTSKSSLRSMSPLRQLLLPQSLRAPNPVQEQRVPRIPAAQPVQEQRGVVSPSDNVQEQRVVFPTLAAANPVLTVPLPPTPIVALLPCPYPPPPGLPPLPPTNNPNHLMGIPSTSPTIPVAPTRRSSRPHTTHLTRVPSSFGYSVHNVP